MTKLNNRINRHLLKQRRSEDKEDRVVLSFYKYFKIEDPQEFRNKLYIAFSKMDVLGRIYVAKEGINAQVSVLQSTLEEFKSTLLQLDPNLNVHLNFAIEDKTNAFWVLRVKVRPRIVADGIEDMEFDPKSVGTYLNAEQLHDILEKEPKSIMIDMRNHYEYEIGHFENAVQIPADTFREQIPKVAEYLKENDYKDVPVVLYCTGGIRCEKTTAYLKNKGFKSVFHIKGGILEYVRQAQNKNLPVKFKGKMFVFDERMAEKITQDVIASCHQCKAPFDIHTNCKNDACHILFLQCPKCAAEFQGCCSRECQLMLNKSEKAMSIKGKIFNKSMKGLSKVDKLK